MFNNINIILNILTVIIILYYIYILIIQYYDYKDFDKNNITKSTDLETISENYKDCELYNLYNNLSNKDKEFLYHIINTKRIEYKENKPKLNKNINNFKNQLFLNMCLTLLIKQKFNSAFDTLKHNTLLNFIS
jgi:hypothetical protein